MTTQTIVQALIVLLSGAAIWLVGSAAPRVRLAGYALGLAAQPFWAWSSWQAEKWGILALTAWYTVAWARGVANHWGGA